MTENDAIISSWLGGMPVGSISRTPYGHSVRHKGVLIAFLADDYYGGRACGYQIACEILQRYSDDLNQTRNQYRWRRNSDGVIYGEMRLPRDQTTLFDKEDLRFVRIGSWGVKRSTKSPLYYVTQNHGTYFHKMITGFDFVDHINRNPLDNRKHNLRASNYLLNARNRSRSRNNTSGISGVGRSVTARGKVRWYGQWHENGRLHIAPFYVTKNRTEEEAKRLAIQAREDAKIRFNITSD